MNSLTFEEQMNICTTDFEKNKFLKQEVADVKITKNENEILTISINNDDTMFSFTYENLINIINKYNK